MGRGGGKWRDRVEGGGVGGGRDGGWECIHMLRALWLLRKMG